MIHYSTSFKALDNYVNRYNAAAAKGVKKLKAAAVATAKEIIRIYGASLFSRQKEQQPSPHFPPLRTNNQQLAGLLKCSPRRIQRYILKLQAAGVITDKAFHGSKTDYELWINPQLLVSSPASVLKTSRANKTITRVSPRSFATPRTNWPLTDTGNINNILNEVDNVDYLKSDFSGDSSGNTGADLERAGNSGNTGSAAGAARLVLDAADQLRTSVDVLNMYINLFWLTAKNLLYKYTSITPQQEQTAKSLIRNLYLEQEDRDLAKVHDIFIQRIKLASEYVQKDPASRFIPLPYIYFNLNNPKGFAGTEEWYWENRKYQANIDRGLLLERLIHRYKNNDKMPMHKRQPPLKLYKACEKRLATYQDEELLNQFYRTVLDHHGIQS